MRARSWLVMLVLAATSPACGDDGGGGGNGDGDGGAGDGDGGNGDGGDDFTSCSQIDVVISVDGSGSMTDELQAMSGEVFPEFAAALLDVGDDLESFRVGTIDACPTPANFHTIGRDDEPCNFASGEVWIESTSPGVVDEFRCVGDINLDSDCSGDNDDEQPASAAATALEPPFRDGDNAGFLRDNAPLVIIAITDEDEQPTGSAETAQEIYDRIVAIKGDVGKVVFYGIGGMPPGGCNGGTYGDADGAQLLFDVTQLFIDQERGVWHDLCAGDLSDGIPAAIEVIQRACDFIVE